MTALQEGREFLEEPVCAQKRPTDFAGRAPVSPYKFFMQDLFKLYERRCPMIRAQKGAHTKYVDPGCFRSAVCQVVPTLSRGLVAGSRAGNCYLDFGPSRR